MKTAIIVLNYNSYNETKEYIEKIKNYNVLDRIVVVDNCSTDDSFENLKQLQSDKIYVVSSGKNGGYSYGNNYGVKYLEEMNEKYDYYIISNSDIDVEEKTISNCITELEEDNKLAVVAPRMFYLNGPARRSSWKIRTYWLDIVHSTRLLELLFYYVLRKGEYSKLEYQKDKIYVDCIAGSFFIIKADVLKEIDYFDENVFLFYEEDILGKKLKDKGYKECSLNTEKFIHYESRTIGKLYSMRKKLKIMDKSKMYYHITYNKAGKVKIALLEVCNFFRKVELLVEIPLRKILKK